MVNNLVLRATSSAFLFLILGLVFYIGDYAVYAFVLVITILSYEEWSTITRNKSKIFYMLGIFTIIAPNSSLIYLYINNHLVFYWFVLVVIANDIFAYLIGKSVGGYRLIPIISAGKTWSGLFGGMVASLIFGSAFVVFFGLPINFAPLSVVVAFLAVIGDLYESVIKRCCNVKDSGSIIPGHGGVLDRVDGFIFTALFAVYLIS